MVGTYRLLTRGDIDGLASAALLTELGLINEVKFIHADDLLTNRIAVTARDILTDLPYADGCHLAFDHHGAEIERAPVVSNLVLDAESPSSARLVFQHFGGPWVFPARLDPMLAAADRAAQAGWTAADVLEPRGWALLAFLLDPRTGVERRGGFKAAETMGFLEGLIEPMRHDSIESILARPEVAARSEIYRQEAPRFEEQIGSTARMEGEVVMIDFRHAEHIPAGNRFIAYALFPAARLSIRVGPTPDGRVMIACGRSIFDRTATIDIGAAMVHFGGTGHGRSGSCIVAADDADRIVAELLNHFRA
ncbi:exopolyphosphatase [Lacibacterium aquatile]|uniref:Exopolyphosphatase n=1 Tax=Lacibacterium aquatile TaxID=1168082 RepID=A0ABW5DT86_9PROT